MILKCACVYFSFFWMGERPMVLQTWCQLQQQNTNGTPFESFFFNTLLPNYTFSRHIVLFIQGEELLAFRSPSHAVAKTFLQLAGEFDFEKTFNEGTLLYSPAAYVLFMTFLITMPVLFTNLLVSVQITVDCKCEVSLRPVKQ